MKFILFSLIVLIVLNFTLINCYLFRRSNRDNRDQDEGNDYHAPLRRFSQRYRGRIENEPRANQQDEPRSNQRNEPRQNQPNESMERFVQRFREGRTRSRARWYRSRHSHRQSNDEEARNFQGDDTMLRAGLDDLEEKKSNDFEGTYKLSNAMVRKRRKPKPSSEPPPPPPNEPRDQPRAESRDEPSSSPPPPSSNENERQSSDLNQNKERETPREEAKDQVLRTSGHNEDHQGDRDSQNERRDKDSREDEDYFVPRPRARQEGRDRFRNNYDDERARRSSRPSQSRRKNRYFEDEPREYRSRRNQKRNKRRFLDFPPKYERYNEIYDEPERRPRGLRVREFKSSFPKDYFRIAGGDQDETEPQTEGEPPQEPPQEQPQEQPQTEVDETQTD